MKRLDVISQVIINADQIIQDPTSAGVVVKPNGVRVGKTYIPGPIFGYDEVVIDFHSVVAQGKVSSRERDALMDFARRARKMKGVEEKVNACKEIRHEAFNLFAQECGLDRLQIRRLASFVVASALRKDGLS